MQPGHDLITEITELKKSCSCCSEPGFAVNELILVMHIGGSCVKCKIVDCREDYNGGQLAKLNS